jgi:hypothetical protein
MADSDKTLTDNPNPEGGVPKKRGRPAKNRAGENAGSENSSPLTDAQQSAMIRSVGQRGKRKTLTTLALEKEDAEFFGLRREIIEIGDPLPVLEKYEPPPTLPRGFNNSRARWAPKFLEALAQVGTIAQACQMASISRQTYLNLKREDPEFSLRCEIALLEAEDRLAHALWKRAVLGVEKRKGIYNYARGKDGTRTAVRVAEDVEITYSDTAAIFLLKAWNPEKYGDRAQIRHSQEPSLKDVVAEMARQKGIPLEQAMQSAEAFLANLRERKRLVGA